MSYKGKGALVLSWSTPVRGREMQALAVFGESIAHFQRLEKDGVVDAVRAFTSAAANKGMVILEGDLEKVHGLFLDEEIHRIIAKSNLVGEDFDCHLMAGGSVADVMEPSMLFAEIVSELQLS